MLSAMPGWLLFARLQLYTLVVIEKKEEADFISFHKMKAITKKIYHNVY